MTPTKPTHWISDAWTATLWFFRSLRQGDWIWLLLAVALASMSVTTVDLLAKTVKQSMLNEAANQMGADLVIKSTRPLSRDLIKQAQTLGLETAESVSLVTMASQGDEFQLVQLKAISENTPLRGQLKSRPLFQQKAGKLSSGQAWVEASLVNQLALSPEKTTITLGVSEFNAQASVQPSGLMNGLSSFAPQIWIALADLEPTQLLGPGSRVSYELSFAGETSALQTFNTQIQSQLDPSMQVVSALAPNEDLAKSLDTAWMFLDLSALSAILVAGLSILIASRFYLQRWQAQMALMRALGGQAGNIERIFTLQLTWLGLVGSALGLAAGILLFQALRPWLNQFFEQPAEIGYGATLFKSVLIGLLVLWSFTWQAFQRALKTPPMSLFRNTQTQPSLWHWLFSFMLVLALLALMTQSASWPQRVWMLVGLSVVSLVLYATAAGLLKVMQTWQNHAQGWFKLALAALSREPGLVKIQLISVGLVLFVLMLLTFVRQDLMMTWQASLPADTPDTFVMNVQPDQKTLATQLLTQAQIQTDLVPMVKGRLVAINDQPILASQQTQTRARRLLEREANMALLQTPPSYNQITARLPDSQQNPALPKVSVEQDIAKLFDIQLGDVLTFNLSGAQLSYQVNSMRSVQWQSFRLNFFFIIQPSQADATLPISYISSFKMPNERTVQPLQKALAEQTPGVLLIDVKHILTQIQTIMSQASWAVTALYILTLLSSILVLLSATQASQQSRVQNWMLLKTLGAQQKVIVKMGLMEFALLGALAGLMAASLAQLASIALSISLLKVEPSFNPWLWVSALALGILGLLLMGWFTQRHYLKQSPKALSRYESL